MSALEIGIIFLLIKVQINHCIPTLKKSSLLNPLASSRGALAQNIRTLFGDLIQIQIQFNYDFITVIRIISIQSGPHEASIRATNEQAGQLCRHCAAAYDPARTPGEEQVDSIRYGSRSGSSRADRQWLRGTIPAMGELVNDI